MVAGMNKRWPKQTKSMKAALIGAVDDKRIEMVRGISVMWYTVFYMWFGKCDPHDRILKNDNPYMPSTKKHETPDTT